MCLDGKADRYRTDFGLGVRYLSSRRPFCFICKFAYAMHSMIHKSFSNRFLIGFYFLAFSSLLFGLTRYSYHAKELLVCWLFFGAFFAVLALIFFGAVLAIFAGQHFLQWLRLAKLIILELTASLAEALQRHLSVPPILTGATLKSSIGSCRPAVDSESYLPIGSAPSPEKPFSETDVQNCTDNILHNS